MTCPDWRALIAAREAEPAADPPAWAEARLHAAHCRRCRSEALAADPLLLFARLPERAVAPREIADMQGAVASLVRASRVAQGGHLPALAPRAAASRTFSASRLAAALGVCSLLALSGAPRPQPAGVGTLAVAGSAFAGAEPLTEGSRPMHSLVEELGRPGARVYELPQADMAVVMIVDASLDV
jgi:hypothetical protein